MKKIFAIACSLLFAAGMLAGCSPDNAGAASGGAAGKDAPKIGLVQMMEHPSLDEIRAAIEARLDEALGEGGTGIGDGVVELLAARAISREMRGDQVPATAASSTIAASGSRAGSGCAGERRRLDIHAPTVAFCATSAPVRARRGPADDGTAYTAGRASS